MSTPDLSRLIGIVLFLALVASIGWALVRAVEAWNTRPMVMFDHKVGHWRAHSLQGKPWRRKRHAKPRYRRPLERRSPEHVPPSTPSTSMAWNDPLLRPLERPRTLHVVLDTLPHPPLEPHPSLEQPITQALEQTRVEHSA